VAARDLARKGFRTLVIESNNYLGGGFWIGGYFMNTLTFRGPGEEILDELGIRYKKVQEGFFTACGPEACSKLIAAACEDGVTFLQMTKCDDVVCRAGRVEGIVVNWTAVSALPRAITCVDPVALEAKVVIDATGHDARVCQALQKRGILSFGECGAMDVVGSEDALVEKTGEVYPGLYACGMSVATVHGIPRMGPTFSGMLYSGRKVAQLIGDKFAAGDARTGITAVKPRGSMRRRRRTRLTEAFVV
jgi:thiamine thiazole synthase